VKVKELKIDVSRTFNLGNYANLRVEAGLVASIEEGDDLEAVRAKMLDEIRKSLSAAYRATYPRSNPGAAT
jgi:hypothetical protein